MLLGVGVWFEVGLLGQGEGLVLGALEGVVGVGPPLDDVLLDFFVVHVVAVAVGVARELVGFGWARKEMRDWVRGRR